jgi:hypothetical protein
MLRHRREPVEFAGQAERNPQLPAAACVEGQELGGIGPLAEQAHLRDFYIPQRGIFAVGRVFVTRVPVEVPAAELTAEVLR